MNVFEDLVVELQEENLLEKPVVESSSEQDVPAYDDLDVTEMPNSSYELPAVGEQ